MRHRSTVAQSTEGGGGGGGFGFQPLFESWLPVAIARPLLAFVVRTHVKNTCRRSRPAALQSEQTKSPTRSSCIETWSRPSLSIRAGCRASSIAVHRVRTIDIDGFVGGQGVGEGLLAWRPPLKGSPQRGGI